MAKDKKSSMPKTPVRKNKNQFWRRAVLAVAAFCAVTVAVPQFLSAVQTDWTQDRRHTLSQGSVKTLQEIEENIDVYFYYSQRLNYAAPQLGLFAQQVQSLLDQYARAGHGRIRLHRIDPEPYSESEDEAIANGIQPIPLYGGTQQAFFGLSVRSGLGNRATIAQFTPNRSDMLEYDLTRLFHSMLHPKKPNLGVITSLPMDSDYFSPLTSGDGAPAPWFFWIQLQQNYNVQKLPQSISAIPDNVDAILIVHPKNLPDGTIYAIDQFILRSGKAVILIDPQSEAALARQPANADVKPQFSELGGLLNHWGVIQSRDFVVGDRNLAQRVVIEDDPKNRAKPEAVDYPGWLKIGKSQMNQNDFLSASVNKLNMATAGAIALQDGSPLSMTPLVQTTPHTMNIPIEQVRYMPDLRAILQNFQDSGEIRTLAARLRGNLTSAFGASAPAFAVNANIKMPDHLQKSLVPANIIMIGDSDLAEDRFWARIPETLQAGYIVNSADNADFILNSIDNVLGGDVFLTIRTRASAARPMDVLQQLRQTAEDRFLAKEKTLQEKLKSAEEKLRQLQSETKEKQAEGWNQTLDQARRDIAQTRLELRAVQHELNTDIQGLQDRIRLILILIWPLILASLAAVGLRRLWRDTKY